jgi:hypothetical protein
MIARRSRSFPQNNVVPASLATQQCVSPIAAEVSKGAHRG